MTRASKVAPSPYAGVLASLRALLVEVIAIRTAHQDRVGHFLQLFISCGLQLVERIEANPALYVTSMHHITGSDRSGWSFHASAMPAMSPEEKLKASLSGDEVAKHTIREALESARKLTELYGSPLAMAIESDLRSLAVKHGADKPPRKPRRSVLRRRLPRSPIDDEPVAALRVPETMSAPHAVET
jgi:hypothetical protein